MLLRKVNQSALPAVLLILALWALLVLRVPQLQAAVPAGRSAAATEHPLATRAALSVLRAGGNAVDGVVAAALVSGVVSPTSSGLGGGGFALYWSAQSHKATALDFRETAPQRLDAAAFEVRPFPENERGRAVGVPGEVAGLFELHRRFGKMPWADLVAPAIEAARVGFAPSPLLSRILTSQAEALRREPGIAQMFYPAPGGAALPVHKSPELAHVLGWLKVLGPAAFYDGPVAGDIVATVQRAGGTISYADLQAYRVVEREPLKVTWEGNEIYTMPPPSAGGLMLAQVLGMFSKKELLAWGLDSGAYIHHIAEAMRASFADRARKVADPAFEPVDVQALLAPARLAARRSAIQPFATRTLPDLFAKEQGTHHLVVADHEGNVVSLTTTVNAPFGAKLMTRSGIVLNNELVDFSKQADAVALGLPQSPNRPRPGARPASSMTPTLVVKDGKPILALGGSGGTRIAVNVPQSLLARLAFGVSAQQAAARPRFAVPQAGATLTADAAFSPALLKDLKKRGEVIEPMGMDYSAVQLIAVQEEGRYAAAADPRKSGFAAVE